ncbi:MAG: PKD domain-containing protein, partial [Candidatus Thermoplasmatota archaeon]|nr:PKD domain-containing protein [Candidatus Thermoplasmatota archaeon]
EVPNQPPTAATDLAVDTFTAAPEITHLLNPTPTFSWTFNDPDVGDTQGDIDVIVSTGPGGTGTVIWDPAPQAYMMESIVFGGGINPQPCETYYFGVLTADDKHLWADSADWSEIMFAMNCPPTVPTPTTPADGAVLVPSATQTVGWDPSTDADADAIDYEVEVNETDGSPVWSETTAGTTSASFTTEGGKCYVWHVRATDSWEYSPWSNDFGFCANTPPDLPTDLMVEGFMVADVDDRMHIIVSQPTFNWTFTDPDGDSQAEYAVEVWTDPDGTGTQMWSDSDTTSVNTTTYAGTTLVLGESYYFRVNASDGIEWSGWSELAFNMSAPPPAPQLDDPANNAVDVPTTPLLNWSAVVDPNGDEISYYWYLDNETTVTTPFLQEGTTTDTEVTITTALTESTGYYWKVCADDGWELPVCSVIWAFTTAAPDNLAPDAVATADRTEAEEGQTINFDGTGSSDPDDDPLTFSWNWGDGTAAGTTETASHSYSTADTYTVILTVSDGLLSDTVTLTITVTEKEELDFLSQYWWILLIIIIIVILVIILLAKRKKPEEEEEAPVEEEEEIPPPEEEPEAAPAAAEEAKEEGADMKECANCGTVLAADDAECFMCGAKV